MRRRVGRDRLIAATIVATPLLMPFYFDYDLLLLSVPRQQRNKLAVLAVASVLLGISGWLAVLAISHDEPSQPAPTLNGPTA